MLVSCCDLRNQDKLPENREEADLFFCSVTSLQKCETRTKLAIQRAMKSSPAIAEITAQKDKAEHPFAK